MLSYLKILISDFNFSWNLFIYNSLKLQFHFEIALSINFYVSFSYVSVYKMYHGHMNYFSKFYFNILTDFELHILSIEEKIMRFN